MSCSPLEARLPPPPLGSLAPPPQGTESHSSSLKPKRGTTQTCLHLEAPRQGSQMSTKDKDQGRGTAMNPNGFSLWPPSSHSAGPSPGRKATPTPRVTASRIPTWATFLGRALIGWHGSGDRPCSNPVWPGVLSRDPDRAAQACSWGGGC